MVKWCYDFGTRTKVTDRHFRHFGMTQTCSSLKALVIISLARETTENEYRLWKAIKDDLFFQVG